jgi:hypothetical protein
MQLQVHENRSSQHDMSNMTDMSWHCHEVRCRRDRMAQSVENMLVHDVGASFAERLNNRLTAGIACVNVERRIYVN